MSGANLFNVLGDDSSFTALTKEERSILKQALEIEMVRREKASQPRQIREIVPIETWVDSEYYLGPNNVRVYDYWKETLCDIFSSKRDKENMVNEVILGGSIGVGKSTVGELILARKFYELSCWENIHAKLKLMSTTSIVFLYFSINKYQANLTGFGETRALIDSIPYFQENFPRNEKIDSIILFPENIMMTYGSGSQHAIGMSMMGSILDEANFFRGESREGELASGSAISRVAELYASIINRQRSRFVNEGGVDESINVLISSSTSTTSFTEQRIRQSKGNPHVVVRTPTLWEVKPNAYSKKFFYVFKGNNSLEPFIVNSVDDVNNYRISEGMGRSGADTGSEVDDFEAVKAEIDSLPEHGKHSFIAVPDNFKSSFETDIIKSLQDVGGVSTAPVGKLFTSVEKYNKCCVDWITHPFITETITVSTGDLIKVSDFLRPGFVFRDLHKPRYVHLDQSATTDCTGISVVHIDRIIEEDGVKKPIIFVDLMIRIIPPKPPKRLAIYKLRDFIVYLNLVKGIKWGKISYDFWNSEESRQILSEMGYEVAYQSVDKNDKAYVDFVTLMYEERVRMYDYTPTKDELFELIHNRDRRKVDHPRRNSDGVTVGSKDVTDSLVGAIFSALQSSFTENVYDGVGDFLYANPLQGDVDSQYYVGRTTEQIIDAEIDRMLSEYD